MASATRPAMLGKVEVIKRKQTSCKIFLGLFWIVCDFTAFLGRHQ